MFQLHCEAEFGVLAESEPAPGCPATPTNSDSPNLPTLGLFIGLLLPGLHIIDAVPIITAFLAKQLPPQNLYKLLRTKERLQ
jgi:hypothetical protein